MTQPKSLTLWVCSGCGVLAEWDGRRKSCPECGSKTRRRWRFLAIRQATSNE